MSESFDPYVHWLGIRDPQRPPNHYRLLGVEPFEADPDVLSNAADRQMAHVRTFQAGKHSAESQELLNELARAKVCLLNAQKKAVYDKELRAKLEAAERNDRPPPPPPPLPAAPPKMQDVPPIPAPPVGGARPDVGPPPSIPIRPAPDPPTFGAGAAPGSIPPPPPPLPSGVPPADGHEIPPSDGSLPEIPPPPEMPPPRGPAPPVGDEAAGEPTKTAGNAKLKKSSCSTASFLISMVLALAALIAVFAVDYWRKNEGAIQDDGRTTAGEQPRPEPGPDPDSQPGQNPPPEPPAEPDPDPSSDTEPNPAPPPEPEPKPPPEPEPDPMPGPDPASEPDLEPPAAVRRAVPAKTVQQETLRQIRRQYRDRYATAKAPAAKRSLADTLLAEAKTTEGDLAARYVLFTQARDLAIAGGDTRLMMRAATALAEEYRIDLPVVAAEGYADQAEKIRGTDKTADLSVVRKGLELVHNAADANDFDSALTLAESTRDLARAAQPENKDLVKAAVTEIHRMTAARPLHAAFVEAEPVLAERPDDPPANLAAGKFYFFVKDDAAAGLAMIAKGSDPVLAALAVAEQTPPTDPAGMIDLAERWQSALQQAGPPDRPWLHNRVVYWYGKAKANSSAADLHKIDRVLRLLGGAWSVGS